MLSDVESVLLYYLFFSISAFFSCLLVRSYRKEYKGNGAEIAIKTYRFLLLSLTLAPMIILFTFRYNVGTDYKNYEYLYRYYSRNNGAIDNLFHAGKEIGYGLINLVAYHVFGSYEGAKFLTSLVLLLTISVALLQFNKQQFTIGWIVYLFTLYTSSYNGTRQHLAVAFCLLSMVQLHHGKLLKSIISCVIAYFFHSLSIIGFLFIAMYIYYQNRKKTNAIYRDLAIIAILGLSIGYILRIISNFSFFTSYYNKYISTMGVATTMHFVTHIAFKLPLSIVIILNLKRIMEDQRMYVISLYTFMDYVFILSSYYIRWAIRMQYFSMIGAPLVLMSLNQSSMNKKNKRMYIALVIVAYVIRFAVIFGYSKYDDVVPFQFI